MTETITRPVGRDLASYGIDAERGFVPGTDPVPALAPRYRPWERIARDLGPLIMTGRLRGAVDALPELAPGDLDGPGERERAFLLLSCLGNAYMWAEPLAAERFPAALAVPWCALAEELGRPPVLAHYSAVVNNWRRLAPDEPVSPTNIDTQVTFLGGVDEKWFYLATVGVELAGAPALPLLVAAQHAVAADDADRLTAALRALEPIIATTTRAFLAMEKWCDPHAFYHRVRPFLAGWPAPGVVYEGVWDEPRTMTGASAAQSSLIQAFDAGLGIPHPHERTGVFLRGMREHMPVPHRRFLTDLEAGPSVHGYAARRRDRPQLTDAYNACVRAVSELRAQHIGLTGRYIGRFERSGTAKGTGGTDFVRLLVEAREETRATELD
ncbi:indoleamine 2,3-dioxygenase [Amycolatopsis sp. NPDC059021]|uniref:indoleamine 2,3-dioxygenase n=1 Tax=Amycolatopsis sp. NPDC059021 TaxID=3346704 RepID=UPI00366CDC52